MLVKTPREVFNKVMVTIGPEAPVEVNSWKDFANCLGKDPSLFCTSQSEAVTAAKAICETCVVREECLEFAITHYSEERVREYNVWGSTTEMERRVIIRERKKASRGQA